MLRSLPILLALALPALAAPVPKAVKKPPAPVLPGTVWECVNVGGDVGTEKCEFADGGRLTFTNSGGRRITESANTWEQSGDTLVVSANSGYATYTFAYRDGVYDGTVVNKAGRTWKATLTPIEKK